MDLAEITQDSRSTVGMISFESRPYVQKVFNRVPNLWLGAESGYEYRINGQWQTLFKMSSKSWLKILKKLMQEYCDNVDGSCVEERSSTIVWNYKNVEEEHGQLCAKELYLQIQHLIGPNAPVEIVQGVGFLEVKPVQLKKSNLLKIFLQELSDQAFSKVDFLLYIGADTSDEPVFEYLKNQIQSSSSQYLSPDCQSFLCILGKKPSKADFYVDEVEKLAVLINKLGVETKKRQKNRSYSNLKEVPGLQKKSGLTHSGQSTNDVSRDYNNKSCVLAGEDVQLVEGAGLAPRRAQEAALRRSRDHHRAGPPRRGVSDELRAESALAPVGFRPDLFGSDAPHLPLPDAGLHF